MPQRPTIERCSIDYAKDELPPITHGKVTFLGDRCVLWEWDAVKGGHRQADSLTNIATTEPTRGSKSFSVTGTSTLLREDIGVRDDDAKVTVTVTPTPQVARV